MRVQSDALNQAAAPLTNRATDVQKADRFTTGRAQNLTGGSYENVELSDLVRNIGQAVGGIISSNASRVNELAAAYQSGRYQVDAGQLSNKLIANSLASGSSVSGRS